LHTGVQAKVGVVPEETVIDTEPMHGGALELSVPAGSEHAAATTERLTRPRSSQRVLIWDLVTRSPSTVGTAPSCHCR
jgi:hypothetical protein